MGHTMEKSMTKRLGIPPKIVERRVSVQAEAKGKLWDAVPPMPGEKLYLWFPRAAREMKNAAIAAGVAKEVAQRWTPRRVRAFWNDEARRIDHIEIKVIELRERLNKLQEGAAKRRGATDGIKERLAYLRSAQGSRDPGGDSGGTGATDGRGLGEGEGGSGEGGRAAAVARPDEE
jgi:hypothetical protein